MRTIKEYNEIGQAVMRRLMEWGLSEKSADYAIYMFTDLNPGMQRWDSDGRIRLVLFVLQEVLFHQPPVRGGKRTKMHVIPEETRKCYARWDTYKSDSPPKA